MHTTICDVAKRLHLSITTVSRALDNYDDVADSTRKLVVVTAKEMGYVPNRAARQLRRQRTDTIGYILPTDSAGTGFADPFFSEFIAGLSDEASAYHFDLLVSAAPPDSKIEKELYKRWVQGGKVDGVVVNRVRLNDWRLRFLARQHIPHASYERSLSKLDFVGIEIDSFNGMLELIEHLVERGYKRIAYVSGAPNLKIDHRSLEGLSNRVEISRDRIRSGIDCSWRHDFRRRLSCSRTPFRPFRAADGHCMYQRCDCNRRHARCT